MQSKGRLQMIELSSINISLTLKEEEGKKE